MRGDFSKAFNDISQFPGLKPGVIFRHDRAAIAESLTIVSQENEEKEAVDNFQNILVWMADRQAQEPMRQAAADAIISTLRLNCNLRDEVFLQVVKQLIQNPSLRSEVFGWELLSTMCKVAAPSDQLFEFVLEFLKMSKAGGEPMVASAAATCMTSLQSSADLPRLRGFLWKRRPAKHWTRDYDWRFFVLRNMQLLWWKNEEDASSLEATAPDGGPLCKGSISLVANSCSVDLDKDKATTFSLLPGEDGWTHGRLAMEDDKKRVFKLKVDKNSVLSREQWATSLMAHLEKGFQKQHVDHVNIVKSFMRVSSGPMGANMPRPSGIAEVDEEEG